LYIAYSVTSPEIVFRDLVLGCDLSAVLWCFQTPRSQPATKRHGDSTTSALYQHLLRAVLTLEPSIVHLEATEVCATSNTRFPWPVRPFFQSRRLAPCACCDYTLLEAPGAVAIEAWISLREPHGLNKVQHRFPRH
jgi:hypothetical protein